MLTREQHQEIIDRIKSSVGEQNGALISDDLATLISDYAGAINDMAEKVQTITDLKAKNEELVNVNGKLFQKVGFKEEEEKKIVEEEEPKPEEMSEADILENLINEKGEIIDE